MKPDIAPEDLKIVQDILSKYLPSNTTVWVFGSRANKAPKKYSDLDLLIDTNGQPLSSSMLMDLADDFDESDLPYKVDLVDWNSISDSFRECIQNDRILLQWE